MEENVQRILELKENASAFEFVTYLESLDTDELKEIYDLYYYAKEIEIENYNKTFLEYQEDFHNDIDEMIMQLSQGINFHALNHYLENISEKIENHEQEIERQREKRYFEEERLHEWGRNHDQ